MVRAPPSWRTRSGSPLSSDSSRVGRSSLPTMLTDPSTVLTSTRSTSSKVSLSGWSSVQVPMASLRDISRLWVDKIYLERRLSSPHPWLPRRRRGRGRDRANKEESVRIGYKLFAEVFSPQELVAQAVRAEEAGFDFVEISNHYHPWLFSHDHSGFAWSI